MLGDICMYFSIRQYDKTLALSKYSIDLDTKVFSSKENDLVLDFTHGWTFKTGSTCNFNTGKDCTFKTGSGCTFKTGYDCTFDTGSICTFKTGDYCTFDTGSYCTFNTGYECKFNTGSVCTFMLFDINTCKFKKYDGIYDGISIILDIKDNNHYVLTKGLIDMLKVMNG